MADIYEAARQYFECVVDPAVDELLAEYNELDGYEAGVHCRKLLTRGDSSVSEVHGLYFIYPGGGRKFVSVCWPVDSETVLIGIVGDGRDNKLLDIYDMDKEELKTEIRELIDGE